MNGPKVPTLVSKTEVAAEVSRRLVKLYAEKMKAAGMIDPVYEQLIAEMAEFINRGGKRMRPYLLYLAYKGYGGQKDQAILDMATGQELFHNFLLIHDDIIDQDTSRYGGPNITGRYLDMLQDKEITPKDRRRYAEAASLLAGDVNFALAFDVMLQADFPSEVKVEAAHRISRMLFEAGGGELLDVLLPLDREQDITVRRLIRVLHYKTASYSFAGPLQIGALVAGADSEQQAAIEKMAVPLGIGYQITDDLLGMFGREAETGKPVLSDLREGKRTVLIANGFALASDSQKKILARHLGDSSADASELAEVKEILESSGARTKTQLAAASYTATALRELDRLSIEPKIKKEIADLAAFAINRKH